MKSPFPGMDPFLEAHWGSVHTDLASLIARRLNRTLPSGLVARPEERVEVISSGGLESRLRLDVSVREAGSRAWQPGERVALSQSALMEPVRLVASVEPSVERFLEVIESSTKRIVTVIELISPSNKTGEGLHDYRVRRASLLEGGANLVEIDFVRAGNWEALLRPQKCPADRLTTYRITTRHADDLAGVMLLPVALGHPVPAVEVPLRSREESTLLELQPLLEEIYEAGRYGEDIDYTRPCVPPLQGEEAAWSKARLEAWLAG